MGVPSISQLLKLYLNFDEIELSPLLATHPKNSPLTPLFATHFQKLSTGTLPAQSARFADLRVSSQKGTGLEVGLDAALEGGIGLSGDKGFAEHAVAINDMRAPRRHPNAATRTDLSAIPSRRLL